MPSIRYLGTSIARPWHVLTELDSLIGLGRVQGSGTGTALAPLSICWFLLTISQISNFEVGFSWNLAFSWASCFYASGFSHASILTCANPELISHRQCTLKYQQISSLETASVCRKRSRVTGSYISSRSSIRILFTKCTASSAPHTQHRSQVVLMLAEGCAKKLEGHRPTDQ